jgi:hypothetical protein
VMIFIEREFFQYREGTWPLTKSPHPFYFQEIVMTFIDGELFHDKRRNLTVCENIAVNFICRESWWNWLKGSSSTIWEWTWPFTIGSGRFYLQKMVKSFIEEELFHNQRKKLTGSESLSIFYIVQVALKFIKKEFFHNKRRNSTV